jgi:uncharacterized protein (DUF2062 family)
VKPIQGMFIASALVALALYVVLVVLPRRWNRRDAERERRDMKEAIRRASEKQQ